MNLTDNGVKFGMESDTVAVWGVIGRANGLATAWGRKLWVKAWGI